MPDMNTASLSVERHASLAHPFISEVAEIRRRARRQILDGAITADYSAERDTELGLLSAALATELACVVRYKRDYFAAAAEMSETIREALLQHASEEQEHTDRLVQRIVELGGTPTLGGEALTERSYSEYGEGETLPDMLAEDLIAERIAIENYREIIQYLESRDGPTRRLFEEILAAEQEHAEELRSLREQMLCRERTGQPGTAQTPGTGELQ